MTAVNTPRGPGPMAGGGRPDLEPAGHALPRPAGRSAPEQTHEPAVDAATLRLLTVLPSRGPHRAPTPPSLGEPKRRPDGVLLGRTPAPPGVTRRLRKQHHADDPERTAKASTTPRQVSRGRILAGEADAFTPFYTTIFRSGGLGVGAGWHGGLTSKVMPVSRSDTSHTGAQVLGPRARWPSPPPRQLQPLPSQVGPCAAGRQGAGGLGALSDAEQLEPAHDKVGRLHQQPPDRCPLGVGW